MKWLFFALLPVCGQVTPVVFTGKILMEDGSVPGKSVGTQRICTDNGSTPGPLTDKQGVFIWRMDVDFMRTRRCWVEGTLAGYDSSQIDISSVNPANGVNVTLAPVKLTLKGGNPYALGGPDKDVPGKGRSEWTAAMKAIQASDTPGAIQQLKAAVAANPKFALAWHNLGILSDSQDNVPDAREAYAKAIENNPKMLVAYAALNRLLMRERDWDGVLKTSAAMIPLDKDRIFPEVYAHQAVAHYYLKDLAAAEAAANTALTVKAKRSYWRSEYVMGRILEAKGDAAGAKQHMARYLELVPSAADAAQIKAHIDLMGKPEAPEPELELAIR